MSAICPRRSIWWTVLLSMLIFTVPAKAASPPAPKTEAALTPEPVLTSLNDALAWYRQARIVMRAVDATVGGLFTRQDQETALGVLQRAFNAARAQVALLLAQGSPTENTPSGARLTQRRVTLEAAIQSDEQQIANLRLQLRSAPPTKRQAAQDALAAATNHDAMQMARIARAGMLFVPSRDGISHNPREWTALPDVAVSAQVLLEATLALAARDG